MKFHAGSSCLSPSLRLQKKRNDMPSLACSIAVSRNLREELVLRPIGADFPVPDLKTASTHTCSLENIT